MKIRISKKIFWKIFPLLSILISFFCFLLLANYSSGILSSLFLSVSANFISIFFLYFLYETVKARSEKELSKEIFQYAKQNIDKDIFPLLYNLAKFFYGFQRGKMLSQFLKVLKLSREDLEKLISDRKFIGFELFKSWDEIYGYFSKILDNSFVLNRLTDEQILLVIKMKNTITNIKMIFDKKDNFQRTTQRVNNFKIQKGENISSFNAEYPNRYILLRDIGDDKYLVEDHGDFSLTNEDDLLNVYVINEEIAKSLSVWSYELFRHIDKWIKLTGNNIYIFQK